MLTPPAGAIAGSPEPIVIMLSEDGGIEVLAEDRTYLVPPASLRTLLFLGNCVLLIEDGDATGRAYAQPAPNRDWIDFRIDGAAYIIHRSWLVRVARGIVPADRLRPARAA
ncbi:MAG: hypothetical protein ABFC89_04700 [Methanospirillum sp.]